MNQTACTHTYDPHTRACQSCGVDLMIVAMTFDGLLAVAEQILTNALLGRHLPDADRRHPRSPACSSLPPCAPSSTPTGDDAALPPTRSPTKAPRCLTPV
jgi:hypothetical protein